VRLNTASFFSIFFKNIFNIAGLHNIHSEFAVYYVYSFGAILNLFLWILN